MNSLAFHLAWGTFRADLILPDDVKKTRPILAESTRTVIVNFICIMTNIADQCEKPSCMVAYNGDKRISYREKIFR